MISHMRNVYIPLFCPPVMFILIDEDNMDCRQLAAQFVYNRWEFIVCWRQQWHHPSICTWQKMRIFTGVSKSKREKPIES